MKKNRIIRYLLTIVTFVSVVAGGTPASAHHLETWSSPTTDHLEEGYFTRTQDHLDETVGETGQSVQYLKSCPPEQLAWCGTTVVGDVFGNIGNLTFIAKDEVEESVHGIKITDVRCHATGCTALARVFHRDFWREPVRIEAWWHVGVGSFLPHYDGTSASWVPGERYRQDLYYFWDVTANIDLTSWTGWGLDPCSGATVSLRVYWESSNPYVYDEDWHSTVVACP